MRHAKWKGVHLLLITCFRFVSPVSVHVGVSSKIINYLIF